MEDKILGTTCGFIIGEALARKFSSQYIWYKRNIKLELNFDNLPSVSELFDFFRILSENKGYISYEKLGVKYNGYFTLPPINGLLAKVLQKEDSFNNILPRIIAYSLSNINNDIKPVFSDIELLVCFENFSEDFVSVSLAIYIMLQNFIKGTISNREQVFDTIKETVFKELMGITPYNNIFYESISDRDLYRLSRDNNIWNQILVSFGVLKTSEDYCDGVKKILLLSGKSGITVHLFSVFFGALYGQSALPQEYITKIYQHFPNIALLKEHIPLIKANSQS